MGLAARICSVASEADQATVEALLGDGEVYHVTSQYEPPTLTVDPRAFIKLPAEKARKLVPFLDAASVAGVFVRERRKTVRETLLESARVDTAAAVAMLTYLSSPDAIWVSEDVYRRLLAACDDDALVQLADDYKSLGRKVRLERARRCTDTESLEAIVGDGTYDLTLLADLVCSGSAEVRSWAVTRAGDRLDQLVGYVVRASGSPVQAMLENPAFADEVVTVQKSRYGHKLITVHNGTIPELVAALQGPSAPAAARLLAASGFSKVLAQNVTSELVHLLDDETLARALENVAGDQLVVLGRDALRRCAELGPVAKATELLESLLPVNGKEWDQARTALVLEGLDLDGFGDWLAARAALLGPQDPELCDAVLDFDLPLEAKFTLLDTRSAPETVTMVLKQAISEGPELTPTQVDRVLDTVEVPRNLVPGLVDLCHPRVQQLDWLDAGSKVNPLDDELARDIASYVGEASGLVRHFAHRPLAVQALLDRAGENPETMATALVAYCRLDDTQKRELVSQCSTPGADALLHGAGNNPLDHAQRAMVLDTGAYTSLALVTSFSKLHPSDGERELLTAELFSAFNIEHTASGERYDAAFELADSFRLADDELVALLCGCPRLVRPWLEKSMKANLPSVELCELLAAADLQGLGADAMVLFATAGATSQVVRDWLWTNAEFTAALQAEPRVQGYRDALRMAWEMLHEAVGGTPEVWAQVSMRLDEWPAGLAALAATCKVASGSF